MKKTLMLFRESSIALQIIIETKDEFNQDHGTNQQEGNFQGVQVSLIGRRSLPFLGLHVIFTDVCNDAY